VVIGRNEIFTGIVTADVSLEWLSDMVTSIKLPEGCFAALVSENGLFICSPDKHWPYNETVFSLAEEYNDNALMEIGGDLKNGKAGIKKIGKLNTGKNWIVHYALIKENKWGVLLFTPAE